MHDAVRDYPLAGVDIFVLNETEAEGLTGQTGPDAVREVMASRYPDSATVLTLGAAGAVYMTPQTTVRQPGFTVPAVDTTAAGDTFIGFFLAEWIRSADPAAALQLGCRAAADCVTRPGASDSIPRLDAL